MAKIDRSAKAKRSPDSGKAKKKAAAAGRSAPSSAWEKRLHSRSFADALRDLVEGEIRAISHQKVGEVVDRTRVRSLIKDRGPKLVDAEQIVDLLLHAQDVIADGLRRRNQSIFGLMDHKLAASIEAMLDEEPVLSEPMEEFIGNLMRQDFIQGLFTDIVYTSIKSFNEKVNPLGRLTMGLLEDQIKSFIRLFMPMLQDQATAFATSRENQANFFSFTSAIMKALLNEPLPNFFGMLSPRQRKQAEKLIRQAMDDRKLETLLTENALAVFDAVFDRVEGKKVGDLLHLHENAGWIAERLTDEVLPILRRPAVVTFVDEEIARLEE